MDTMHTTHRSVSYYPPFVCILINRFTFTRCGRICKNSSDCVISCSLYDHDVLYELFGFICHIGDSNNSGHYINYIKISNTWYKWNDSVVNKIKLDNVLSSDSVYLFFYRKYI